MQKSEGDCKYTSCVNSIGHRFEHTKVDVKVFRDVYETEAMGLN